MPSRRSARVLLCAVLAIALPSSLLLPGPTASAAPGMPGWFNPLAGQTIADSSTGVGIPKGKLGANVSKAVVVVGRGGVPATGVTAVDLLVRVTGATKATRVVVYPDGITRPNLGTVHVNPGQTATVSITVPLSSAGSVRVHNRAGSANVAMSVLAWYAVQPGDQPTGAAFTAATTSSLGTVKVASGTTKTVPVAGKARVPSVGTSAVQLLIGATASKKPVSVTVWPASGRKPSLASLTIPAGSSRTTSLVVPLGMGVNAGKVKVTVTGATTSVTLAHQGWFSTELGAAPQRLTSVTPVPLADTATGLGVPKKKLGKNGTVTVTARGHATVPTDATAVVVGLVGSSASAATTLTAYAGTATRPGVGSLSLKTGEVVGARAVVPLSRTGTLKITNKVGTANVQVVVEGYLTPYAIPDVPDPDPPVVLPPSVVDAARALTTGANPRQAGVASGTLEDAHVSIVTGVVSASSEGALVQGAEVTIVDHPEYGRTTSADDGSFAMAVNGGATLVAQITKTNFLPVQRTQSVPWLVWQSLLPVALTDLDPVRAVIDQDATTVQSVTSTRSTDSAGSRSSSLLFEPGTAATMTLPDGTERALGNAMTVRATEFTTGQAGQEAMPGLLPVNSGYTFAAEFSVDEALAAGATEVSFSKPVNTYVDNFLDLPAGTIVPSGYYDRSLGRWVAGPNGTVLEVKSITSGAADLNLDGDPAADPDLYAGLSIDTAERTKLGQLYTVGSTLWRVAVEHFTPWDYNYPYGPPTGAGAPPGPSGTNSGEQDSERDPCASGGSVILCESQTLQETLDVVGTPLTMRYSSDEVPGRVTNRTLRVRLRDGAAFPGPLKDIAVSIDVAGRTFDTNLDPATSGQYYTFVWDGLDAAGTPLRGDVLATVTVGYGYKFEYKSPQAFENSFGQFGAGTLFRRNGTTPASRPESSYVERSYTQQLSSADARSLGNGGWSFDQVNRYDPVNRRLLLGDGRSIAGSDARSAAMTTLVDTYSETGSVRQIGQVRGLAVGPDGSVYYADSRLDVVRKVTPAGLNTVVAGGGDPADGIGDGLLATDARLESPWDVAIALDGSLLISDTGNDRVRQVDADGVISTLVGGNSPADDIGDGLDASHARLRGPRGIAVSPAGALYITDTGHDRVRMLSTDGAVTTVAGGGSPADGVGDGLLGTRAALELPVDVATSDSRVLIADVSANRVRQVGIDGTISTVAGNGQSGAVRDGVPATQSPLAAPYGIATNTLGELLIADQAHNRVRRVSNTGVITTAAGTGSGAPFWSGELGDGALATKASITAPSAVAVSPSGDLVIADTGNSRIRRAGPSLPGLDSTVYAIPSDDGSEVYTFDEQGLHTATLDGVTGIPLLRMAYDDGSRLTSVTDVHGRVTNLQRTSAGVLTDVVSPDGQRTSFTTDANGWLASATEPGGAITRYGSTVEGLLTSLTDRAGGVHLLQYDAAGRLVRDQQPWGGYVTLASQSVEGGSLVTVAAPSGARRTIETLSLPDASVRRTITEADGSTAVVTTDAEGGITLKDTRGSTTEVENIPDPRWGSLVQVPVRITTTQPGGASTIATLSYEVDLEHADDPFSVIRTKRTITSPLGKVVDSYDASTRSFTHTGLDGVDQVVVTDALNQVVSEHRGSSAVTATTYDAKGLVTGITVGGGTGQGRSVSFTYDGVGHPVTSTDTLGRITRYVTDALGRVTKVTSPDGGVVDHGYDGEGRLTSVTPASRARHDIGVVSGQMTSFDFPGGVAPELGYSYDLDGNLAAVSRPDNRSSSITYESGGRVAAAASPGSTVGYSYADNLLRSVTLANGDDVAIDYDGARATSRYTWSGPVSGTVAFPRNADLRTASVQVNSSTPVPYTYAPAGQVLTAGGLSISYDADGLRSGDQAGTVQSSVVRNLFDEPTSVSWTAGGSIVLGQDDTRDKLGRATSRTENVGGTTTTIGYAYDVNGRLAGVTRGGAASESYTYDLNGNRLTARYGSAGPVTAAYDARDRITSLGATTFFHDAAGQRTSRVAGGATTTYAWTAAGHLSGVDLPGTQDVSYVLDGLNRRVGRKVAGDLVEGYLYDANRRVVGWTDRSGALKAQFVYTEASTPALMISGGKTYRLVSDVGGSVRAVVDTSSGEVVQRLDYDAFGRVVRDTAPGLQPFGFAGGLYDRATGLVKLGARDYDPETGRWMSPDPAGYDGEQTNLYSYVDDDPVNYADPSGLFGFPGFDLPSIHIPVPDGLACFAKKAKPFLEVVAVIPGPIGMAAGVAATAAECVQPSGCSIGDIVNTAVGFVPGAKLAEKAVSSGRAAGKAATAATAAGRAVDGYNQYQTYQGYNTAVGNYAKGASYAGNVVAGNVR